MRLLLARMGKAANPAGCGRGEDQEFSLDKFCLRGVLAPSVEVQSKQLYV